MFILLLPVFFNLTDGIILQKNNFLKYDIKCTGNTFVECSVLGQYTRSSSDRHSVLRLSTIPHMLKMQLASLLDPPDHIRGHNWQQLAGVLGLDEKVPYLQSKG